MQIVFTEAAVVSGLAGIIGYWLGYGTIKIGLILFSEGHPAMMPVDLVLAFSAVLTALVVGLLSSAYPAVMAARLDPNDALRTL